MTISTLRAVDNVTTLSTVVSTFSDHCRIETVRPPSDHYCIDTVVPSGDHYGIDIVVPSSDHCDSTITELRK